MLKRVSVDDPFFQQLVQALDRELTGRYGAEQEKLSVYNQLDLSVHAVVVFEGMEPVGCGSFRCLADGVVEIKRMYVRPDWRNRGKGQEILSALEEWAREEKFKRAILETGILQPEAVASYTRSGYQRIENYGPYKGSSYSICMGKDL